MSQAKSFYWHDYETWGIDPRLDRASQFAGIRTDLDFNPIGKPLMIYARPADDFLPQPGACMVTGLTPQECRDQGVPEADFFQAIQHEFSQPGTCALGYNSIRFDDEFTRYGFYRNFIDPYAREWRNGNSRWDIIDMVRLVRALRPEGIEWPVRDAGNGITSFRLEELTAANGIEHQGAHDALSDVYATIALAKLIKEAQPKLFDYVLSMRQKQKVATALNINAWQPVLHVSARYPAKTGCLSAVVPLAMHPTNKNGIIVYDLRQDPASLLELPAEEIRRLIYTRSEDLKEGEARIPLKTIHINRTPIVVPMNTLTPEARQEWQMDPDAEARHLEQLRNATGLQKKLAQVFSDAGFESSKDPDQGLYDGFISNADRRLCDQIQKMEPADLAKLRPVFETEKLHEMLFRYRARNWPETLTRDERQRWQAFRLGRIKQSPDTNAGASISLTQYQKELSRLVIDSALTDKQRAVVNALLDWPDEIGLNS